MIHIILIVFAGWAIVTALISIFSIFFSLLAIPFGLMHEFTGWWGGTRLKDIIRRNRKISDENQKLLDRHFYSREFGEELEDAPKSGDLDRNGIPYL
jgi:hypothetical protein